MKPNINSKEYRSAISVEQMRKSDAYTIKNYTESKELMLRAAKGIFASCNWQGKKTAIICGSGNNGGDGYALAGLLSDIGELPDIYRICDKFSEDGKYYYDIAISKGAKDNIFSAGMSFENYDITVDCIFGTGFKGIPQGIAAEAIEAINKSGAYVICADINSGINGDTGEAKLAVRSDLTVSVGYYKKGMFINDAPGFIKDLINIDIGIVLTE